MLFADMPSIVKKRPAASDTCMLRERPAANASQSPRQAATPVTLSTECLEKVLEYVYEGALDDIQIHLHVDGLRDIRFREELHDSNVPANLLGRVLENGNILLCSGQLPLIDREKCARKNCGMTQEGESLRWLFREFRGQLQIRAFCVEYDKLPFPQENYWQGPWTTFGKVLKGPYPIAALDKCLNQSLCEVAPCNYRYVLCHNVLTFRTLAPSEANGLVACGRMCRMSWSCDEDYPKPYAEVQADDVFVCACPAAVRQHCVPRRCWDCFVRHCTIQPFHSIAHHLRAPDVNLEWGA